MGCNKRALQIRVGSRYHHTPTALRSKTVSRGKSAQRMARREATYIKRRIRETPAVPGGSAKRGGSAGWFYR